MRRVLVTFVIAAAGSLLFAGAASAATITVNSGIDGAINVDSTCTLREAIQSTNTDADAGGCTHSGSYGSNIADTINLPSSNGIYGVADIDTPNSGEDANQKGDFDIVAGAGLTVQGDGIKTALTGTEIDASGGSFDRIFHILPTSTGPVTISGMTLNGGRADHNAGEKGGAILNEGGNLTVTGVALTANSAGSGGAGIETNGSSTTQITDTSITGGNQCCDTTAESGGGGIGVSSGGGGSLSITNSEIGASGGGANQAQGQSTTPGRGGGIYFAPTSNATLSVTDSRIVSNAVNSNGGGTQGAGVYIAGATGSTVTFTRTLIDGNTSSPVTPTDPARGDGVYIDGPGATFTDSLISNNTAFVGASGTSNEGAGMYVNSSSGAVRLVGTTVASNSPINGGTARAGAGIYNKGTLVLLNSTVEGNSAGTGTGGGLKEAGGTATIVNSTFAGNGASTGSNIAQTAGTATVRGSIAEGGCSGTITTGGFNVSDEHSCWSTAGTDLADAGTHLNGLQDNGGDDAGGTFGAVAVPTDEPDLSSSDAIDHIPSASCTDDSASTLTGDQRGYPRPIDGNGDLTDACDSGAVEVAACNGDEATIVGTNGNDSSLDGTATNDVIVGAGGNDTIDGKAGLDEICGGPGNDTLTGGAGADSIFGGPGLDTIHAQDGVADTINCTGGGPDSGTVDTSPAETYVGCDTDGDGVVDFLDSCPTQSGTSSGCPASTPPPTTTPPAGPTGQRAAALKKCKKKKSAQARRKCKAKANKLPV
jgi:CSLREA domain-containing protein